MVNDDPAPSYRDTSAAAPAAAAVGVEEIGTAACWRLIEASSLGRLAVQNVDGHPDVFPLNYLVHEGSLYVRSAPGAKLRSLVAHPEVAFEVDGITDAFHWSVVIRGRATRMNTDAAIAASGVLQLISSSPTAKHNYLRLVPDTVTGRRFAVGSSAPARADDARATPEREIVTEEHVTPRGRTPHRTADKPQPIPHLRPWTGG
ncbi:pyridoxamine 5'-phosphate oxidase family protein [Microbacterium luteolum]|nr:pyridoxamine 5'-phosphate oxidase family protein [Microbacterium luteolum]